MTPLRGEPPTVATWIGALAEWLLPAEPPAATRLVVAIDGSSTVELTLEPGRDPSAPPGELRASCMTWDLVPGDSATTLRVTPHPSRVAGRLDEPGTLYALHELAARRRDARIILKLPPEHVGRRW